MILTIAKLLEEKNNNKIHNMYGIGYSAWTTAHKSDERHRIIKSSVYIRGYCQMFVFLYVCICVCVHTHTLLGEYKKISIQINEAHAFTLAISIHWKEIEAHSLCMYWLRCVLITDWLYGNPSTFFQLCRWRILMHCNVFTSIYFFWVLPF